MSKSENALRTISELAEELGVAQHILRYWETRFPQLKPLTRAGNRRYYRPEDVSLARRINDLLNREGFTIKGAQQVLAGGYRPSSLPPAPPPAPNGGGVATTTTTASVDVDLLKTLRDRLQQALDLDQAIAADR